MSRIPTAVLALGLALAPGPAPTLQAATPRAAHGSGGAVASGDAAATAIGLEILAQGGNAIDAAVATALALAVTLPEAGNLGGGGFAVVRANDAVTTLDFRETAPAAARRDLYLDEHGEAIPDASLIGPLATGVPGSPVGLWELHQRFGHLAWPQVVLPAEHLARDGFRISTKLHASLERKRDLLQRFAETAAVWLPDGRPPEVGSLQRLPQLAATLEAYRRQGPEAITHGPLAAAIVNTSRRYGGVLTTDDLAGYRAVWRPPVLFTALGWQMAGMDLPSSGGIILGQTLHLLEQLDWSGQPRRGANRAHLLAEVWRRAFADRFRLGDPGVTEADAATLLARSWLARRAAGIDRERATRSSEITPWAGETATESTQTTHISVIDADGRIVALTTTLNGTFGCGLLVPETGFLLNNEMDDFNTVPGQPNLYGLIQGEANTVAAGRRMLSSMAPTIAWRGNEAVAVGGRGGSRIPTAVSQVLLWLIADGDPLQAAIDRPRIHHQWLPDRIVAEPGALSSETQAALEARGHHVEINKTSAKIHAARRLADGRLEAAADPRAPGTAGVVHPEP